MEAHIAAQLVSKAPSQVRGGPWSQKDLADGDLAEIRGAAKCSSLTQLWSFAETCGPHSKLWKHLRNLKLTPLPQSRPKPLAVRPVESKVLNVRIKVCREDVQVAKSRSGARTPGTSLSGAQKRFHKLSLPKKVMKTCPTGATLSPTPLGSPERGVAMCHFRGS